MFHYDKMVETAETLAEKLKRTRQISFEDVARETFVTERFFWLFQKN
jgi:dsDNA-binding SOS-regulon protein